MCEDDAGSVALIGEEEFDAVGGQHLWHDSMLTARAPGVDYVRGSGSVPLLGSELVPVVVAPVLVARLERRSRSHRLRFGGHRCLNRGLHRRLDIRFCVGDGAGRDGLGLHGRGAPATTARRIVLVVVTAA